MVITTGTTGGASGSAHPRATTACLRTAPSGVGGDGSWIDEAVRRDDVSYGVHDRLEPHLAMLSAVGA